MITISPPHAVLNDPRATGIYRMRYSYTVGQTEARDSVLAHIVGAAAKTPNGQLSDVVISAHGNAGHIQLGEGFRVGHASLFSVWAGKVHKIWFTSCRVAARDSGGHSLPSRIARAAQCFVVASTETQVSRSGHNYPHGRIGSLEGLVLVYGPTGLVTSQHRYRSAYQDSDGRWHSNPDE